MSQSKPYIPTYVLKKDQNELPIMIHGSIVSKVTVDLSTDEMKSSPQRTFIGKNAHLINKPIMRKRSTSKSANGSHSTRTKSKISTPRFDQ